jgi:hypothetical protein
MHIEKKFDQYEIQCLQSTEGMGVEIPNHQHLSFGRFKAIITKALKKFYGFFDLKKKSRETT